MKYLVFIYDPDIIDMQICSTYERASQLADISVNKPGVKWVEIMRIHDEKGLESLEVLSSYV